jgi:hypothetical protein
MSDFTWDEIPASLGAALWVALRADMMLDKDRTVGAHASFSDTTGYSPLNINQRPTMMTVVGTDSGPILKLEPTWDRAEEGDYSRTNGLTRYWVPCTAGYPDRVDDLECDIDDLTREVAKLKEGPR